MTKASTRLFSAALFFAAMFGLGSQTRAETGYTLDQFQPAPPGDRFFGVQGADPGGHLLPRLMLLGDYGYKPLVLYNSEDSKTLGNVVSHQLVLHAAAGISLWDRLLISANMPLALVTNGTNLTVDGQTLAAPSGAAPGDLRVGLRVRLVGEARSIATLGLAGYLFLPTSSSNGDKNRFAGEGKIHGTPALVLSGENNDLAYAVNAGVDLRAENQVGLVTVGHQLVFGGAFALLLADKTVQVGPEIYGNTIMSGGSKFKASGTNLEAILGLRVRLGPVVLGAAAGPGITHGLGTPALRVVLGVAYAPVPEPPPPPLPPPPPPKKKPAPPRDRDKDGIPDKVDACPDEPGVKSDDPEKNGCPPPPPDRDEDGIPDKEDACPDIKGVKTDDPTTNGCPPDTDGDGIRDDVDACPHEKGSPDPDPQKNGCPRAVRVTDQEIVILEQVQFKTGSAVIMKASDDLLMQVAMVIAEHPEIQKLEVQGHTDNRGGKAYNQKLSERRAASVVKWLTSRGNVDSGRLTSHGYGLEEPIAENTTAEGRQKNRRVQFKIAEKSSTKKSGVEQ